MAVRPHGEHSSGGGGGEAAGRGHRRSSPALLAGRMASARATPVTSSPTGAARPAELPAALAALLFVASCTGAPATPTSTVGPPRPIPGSWRRCEARCRSTRSPCPAIPTWPGVDREPPATPARGGLRRPLRGRRGALPAGAVRERRDGPCCRLRRHARRELRHLLHAPGPGRLPRASRPDLAGAPLRDAHQPGRRPGLPRGARLQRPVRRDLGLQRPEHQVRLLPRLRAELDGRGAVRRPGGRLNDCLQCDEDRSGPVFKATAGRTRRNSGIRSSIERPAEQVAPVVHDYLPPAPPPR